MGGSMFEWLKSSKRAAAISAAAVYASLVLLDPLVTIFRLNVETWAQEHGYDKLYRLLQMPEWLIVIWDFVTGQFGLGFIIGALIFAFWDAAASCSRVLISTIATWIDRLRKATPPRRLPLTAFREEAIKQGWEVHGGVSHDVLDIISRLRQAGLDGVIEFYGRPHRNDAETLNRKESCEPIDRSHWRDFEIEFNSFRNSEDNFSIESYPFHDRERKRHYRYHDLRVDGTQAASWLASNKPLRTDPKTWPDFKKWDRDYYELYEAACLFFDKEPKLPMSPDAQRLFDIWREEWLAKQTGYLRVLVTSYEAVKSAVETSSGAPDETFHPEMQVTKKALIVWCEANGEHPRFLFKYRRGRQ